MEQGETTGPEIIVVGAGTAGLPLAIAAAESGVPVLLIDKADRIGGTLWLSGASLSAGGTRLQRARGIEDSPDAHADDIVRIGHGACDESLVRLACQEAPAMIDWIEQQGVTFTRASPYVSYAHTPYRVARTYSLVDGGRGLLALFERLIAPHLASGRIRLLLATSVSRLIVEDGAVAGVVAGNQEFRAPATVLASGGFGSYPDLFAELSGGCRPVSITLPTSTGDAIALTRDLRAALFGVGRFLPTIGGFEDPVRPGRFYQDPPGRQSPYPQLIPQNRPPWEVWLTSDGDRFLAEDEPDIEIRERAVKALPGMRFWLIWDETILNEAPSLIPTWSNDEIRRRARAADLVLGSDSLDGLAGLMGVPAAALESAIADYNAAIFAGAPDRLGRRHRPRPIADPPFYAILQHGATVLSWPGLRVNAGLQVQNDDDQPIPGLYAVGEALGVAAFMGDAFCGGMSAGPAIALGRWLGRRLADVAREKRVE